MARSLTVLALASGVMIVGLPPPHVLAEEPRCFGERATIEGTWRSETIRGTQHRDVIVGKDAQDHIYGRGGNDLICGNGFYISEEDSHGSDDLHGGPGDDKINGGLGDDGSHGGVGDDLLLAGPAYEGSYGDIAGDDLEGGLGDDRLIGGPLNDNFYPGSGRDFMDGRRSQIGDDSVSYETAGGGVVVDLKDKRGRGQGRDRILDVEIVYGSDFGDRIFGTFEENSFAGGDGPDVLAGRGGNDALAGGRARDRADGGAGRDACVAEQKIRC